MNEPAPRATADLQASWTRVERAASAEDQAAAVEAFLRALPAAEDGPPTLSMTAKDVATGRVVGFDDPALMQRPQAHEVTVAIAGGRFVFRPLSPASLAPLMRE